VLGRAHPAHHQAGTRHHADASELPDRGMPQAPGGGADADLGGSSGSRLLARPL